MVEHIFDDLESRDLKQTKHIQVFDTAVMKQTVHLPPKALFLGHVDVKLRLLSAS